jgi:hypothetical protein
MNDSHPHNLTPALTALETIGSTSPLDARGDPHNTGDYSEGANARPEDLPLTSSVHSAIHESILEFRVLPIGGATTGGGPRHNGISVIVSCRSDDNGYIFRGDLWPGKGFEEEGGKERFDKYHRAFARVISEPEHWKGLNTLGAYESYRRKLPEGIKVFSKRIKRTARNPELLAAWDFDVFVRSIIEGAGIEQPKDGFNFSAAQPPFYDYYQRHRDGQTVDQDKKKTPETKLKPPNSRLERDRSVDDMIYTLEGPCSEHHAAWWECGGKSVPLIPMKFDPYPDKKSTQPEKIGQNTERQTARSKRSSISPSPSLRGVEARAGDGSQNDLAATWPPDGVRRYLEVPNTTTPTLSSNSSNSSHSSTLPAFPHRPGFSATGGSGISYPDSEIQANRPTQTVYTSFQGHSSQQPATVRDTKQKHRSRHHARQASSPYGSQSETSKSRSRSRTPAPHSHRLSSPQSSSFQFPQQQQLHHADSSTHPGQHLPSQDIESEQDFAEITFTEHSQLGQQIQQEPNNPEDSFPHLYLTEEGMQCGYPIESSRIPGIRYPWEETS